MRFKRVFGFDTETYTKDSKTYPMTVQLYTEDYEFARRYGRKVGSKWIYAELFEVYKQSELERFVNLIITSKFRDSLFVTFNMSFDLSVLSLLGLKVSVIYNSRFVCGSIDVSRHKIKVMDLRNILQVPSLYELGRWIGLEKLEHPVYLGTYQAVKLYESNPQYREYFKQYALRDAEICYHVFQKLKNKGVLGFTAGSCAVKTFSQNYKQIAFPEYPDEITQKLRKSYRGGRTEVIVRGTIDRTVKYYDINSLYPYVMWRYRYPYISRNTNGRFIKKNSVDLEFEGVALVELEQDSGIPPLGVKRQARDGFVKLVFPRGRIVDWFTYPELRLVEDLGGKITKVHEAFEFKIWWYPFEEFVEDMYAKRIAHKNNKLLYKYYKILMNSLYGKFGEYKPSKSLVLEDGAVVKTEELQKKHRYYHNVVMSSYITAYGRLALHEYMRKIPEKQIYYCDTDSLFTSYNLDFYVSDSLGSLKFEGEARPYESTFIRSKFYLFGDTVRLKGFIVENHELVKQLIRLGSNEMIQKLILKPLEAKRRSKRVLSEVVTRKVFSTEPDWKREYLKMLNSRELLETSTESEPISLREGGLSAYYS